MGWQTSAADFVRENAGKEHHFLRTLNTFTDNIPQTELRSLVVHHGFSIDSNSWSSVLVYLLFAFVLLQTPPLLTFSLVKARYSWAQYWRPWLAYLVTVFGTGLFVFFGMGVFSSLTLPIRQKPRQAREIRCHLDYGTAAAIVQGCLMQRGYESVDQQYFAFDTVPKGNLVAELRLALYRKTHGEWRLGWRGARRTASLLNLQILSSVRPAETVITLNADAGGLLSEEALQEWTASADALAAAVKQKDVAQ